MAGGVLIYGAGGHAKVVLDAAMISGVFVAGIVDDDARRAGSKLLSHRIDSAERKLKSFLSESVKKVVIAIGDNDIRLEKEQELIATGFELQSIIHPQSILARSAQIAEGCMVMAGAVMNPCAVVGPNSILNTRCVVEHDCLLGHAVHVAPNATLGGSVRVGDRSLIGLGASVLPGIRIGNDVVVGAGAVVSRNVPDDTTVVGNPARPF